MGSADFLHESPETERPRRSEVVCEASAALVQGAKPNGSKPVRQAYLKGRQTERLLRLFTSAPNAFWRHDVDVSLSAAAAMARFAHLAGVRSTFYVMAESEHYNVFSPEGRRVLEEIHEHGHRIGVHSTAGVTVVGRAQRLFEVAYPDLVDTREVSFHMPDPSVLWRHFPGFRSAYAPEWKGRYVSDSRGEWDDAKAALVSDDMQVALHPEHWFGA